MSDRLPVAYDVSITVHTWLRWVLLALALANLVLAIRQQPWTRTREHLANAFVGLARIQVLVGLALLLWTSPIATLAWKLGPSASLQSPVLAWFGYVHPALMMIAVAILEAGQARVRRADTPGAKNRTLAIATGLWLVVACAAIPWPGLPWGRPLVS